ncbi:MAG: SDR family NAD(P)-dependent oxidoreductase [Candidatus Dormibacteria bacterium]
MRSLNLDQDTRRGFITGKRILVTGGTGSFGNQIIRQIAPYAPEEIRVFSRDEDKQDTQRHTLRGSGLPITHQLGDVRDMSSVRRAVRGIDIIFHAAALKQVPSCESEVWQAVQTNITGAHHVIEAALQEQVDTMIAISTDKAVEPINAMGMTKALQEKLMLSAALRADRGRVRFACVRYGNVVGSRGSVIPLFHSQLRSGKRVTITDPTMTRYVLTLERAVDLVLDAARECQGGEIFVRDSAASTVGDLASVMVAATAGAEAPVVTGRRPGEKLHETLVSEAESHRAFLLDDVIAVLPETTDRDTYALSRTWKALEPGPRTSENARRLDPGELQKTLEAAGWLAEGRLVSMPVGKGG